VPHFEIPAHIIEHDKKNENAKLKHILLFTFRKHFHCLHFLFLFLTIKNKPIYFYRCYLNNKIWVVNAVQISLQLYLVDGQYNFINQEFE